MANEKIFKRTELKDYEGSALLVENNGDYVTLHIIQKDGLEAAFQISEGQLSDLNSFVYTNCFNQ